MCDYGEDQPNGNFAEGCIAADAMGVTLLDDGMLMIAFPSGRKGTYEMESRTERGWIKGKLVAINGEPVIGIPAPSGWGQVVVPLTRELREAERVRAEEKRQAERIQAERDLAAVRAVHGAETEMVPIDDIRKGDRIIRAGIIGQVIEVESIRTVSNRYRSVRGQWGVQRRIDLGTLVYRLP